MKVALMSYHKNLTTNYPAEWIAEYSRSIEAQTFRAFDIYEVSYGSDKARIFDNSVYLHQEFNSFNHVQNFLLNFLFEEEYDAVFNSNVDDIYSVKWVETMLAYIDRGFDLVSCNFVLISEEGKHLKKHHFEKLNIAAELNKNHNPICHPAVCYSKKFWERGNRYNPDDVKNKNEDMMLWRRAIANSRFIIAPEHLCYHRIHSNSVCQSNNK